MNAEGSRVEAGRLDDVGVRFGKVWAVRHASAVIPTGSVVAVVGTNGAGKTSLIRALVGLQPLSEGSISVLGGRLRTDDPADLARIGYVGQRKPLYGYLRVREMLRYGQVTNPGWNSAFAQRVRDVGIDPNKRIEQLSGGQRTQIALTMALAKQPDLLVLDEPLSDLDPLARQQVLAGLMADVAERGITVVLSSHILGEPESTCDQVIALHAGRLVLAGDIDTIIGGHLQLTGPPTRWSNCPGRARSSTTNARAPPPGRWFASPSTPGSWTRAGKGTRWGWTPSSWVTYAANGLTRRSGRICRWRHDRHGVAAGAGGGPRYRRPDRDHRGGAGGARRYRPRGQLPPDAGMRVHRHGDLPPAAGPVVPASLKSPSLLAMPAVPMAALSASTTA